jgi:hypothetical protein
MGHALNAPLLQMRAMPGVDPRSDTRPGHQRHCVAASGRRQRSVGGARIVALMDEHGWAERAAVPTQRIAALPDTVS